MRTKRAESVVAPALALLLAAVGSSCGATATARAPEAQDGAAAAPPSGGPVRAPAAPTATPEPTAPAEAPPGRAAFEVRVDPRVELLCVLARLAGFEEYGLAHDTPYARDARARFDAFADHPAVETLKLARLTRGVGYDAVVSMAVHLGELPALEERGLWEGPERSLEKRWLPATARRFREEARAFAEETDFAGFLRDAAPYLAETEERFRELLARRDLLAWSEAFFGSAPGARFHASPGLQTGPNCYAATVAHGAAAARRQDVHQVIGVWRSDADGLPVFEEGVLATVCHELAHAFVNPMVERHRALFEEPGEALFAHVEDVMRRQAYPSWQIMVCESIVRASCARFAREGEERERAIAHEEGRGFAWTRALSDALARYEADRAGWPDLDAFAPELAAILAREAERLDAAAARAAAWATVEPDVPPELEAAVDRALSEALVRVTRALAAPDGEGPSPGGAPPEGSSPDAAALERVRATLAAMRFDADVQVSVLDASGAFVYHVQGLRGSALGHRDVRGRDLYRAWLAAPGPQGTDRTLDFPSLDGARARANAIAWARLPGLRWLVVAEGHRWQER